MWRPVQIGQILRLAMEIKYYVKARDHSAQPNVCLVQNVVIDLPADLSAVSVTSGPVACVLKSHPPSNFLCAHSGNIASLVGWLLAHTDRIHRGFEKLSIVS
ncbi:hypothetical protein RRG08_005979 [Elysia crispata]|uniref:Uncharacterized protein n=1 Tax=Elysia crispata TaxID=231223 RepID=A0AAE1D2A9_9GAST|nr:hypothetical protein RRG08_005979 [Elysia crispata]